MMMDTISTLPELQQASLDGIKGLGYAEVIKGIDKAVRGVIVFDNHTDLSRLKGESTLTDVVYEGVVYDDEVRSYETLIVEILLLSLDENAGPGATFRVVDPSRISERSQ